jgi:hypothetical protein
VVLLLVALLVVVGGAILLVPRISTSLESDDPVARDAPEVVDRGLDLDAVTTYGELSRQVVTTPVTYDQVPPVGGAHWRRWLDCGVYDVPVRNENAVASLERGTVWLTYRPSMIRENEVDKLVKLLPENGILSPYEDIPSPVVATVWGAQLYLTGADDRRLPEFLRVFGNSETAPKKDVTCGDGVTDPEGDPT